MRREEERRALVRVHCSERMTATMRRMALKRHQTPHNTTEYDRLHMSVLSDSRRDTYVHLVKHVTIVNSSVCNGYAFYFLQH